MEPAFFELIGAAGIHAQKSCDQGGLACYHFFDTLHKLDDVAPESKLVRMQVHRPSYPEGLSLFVGCRAG
jgi:hypothetical protein